MPAENNCLGIPIRYDSKTKVIVDSGGLWRWQNIVVGPTFFRLAPREQAAFLLHEAGHCKLNHHAKLLWFILRSPQRILRFLRCALSARGEAEFFKAVARRLPEVAALRHAQEFEADRFAAGCGYGPDLVSAFGRIQSDSGPFHPPPVLRIHRLLGE